LYLRFFANPGTLLGLLES
jgi:hypothetical protein